VFSLPFVPFSLWFGKWKLWDRGDPGTHDREIEKLPVTSQKKYWLGDKAAGHHSLRHSVVTLRYTLQIPPYALKGKKAMVSRSDFFETLYRRLHALTSSGGSGLFRRGLFRRRSLLRGSFRRVHFVAGYFVRVISSRTVKTCESDCWTSSKAGNRV
jgi:hypothetical protein